ncbi:hypothetical protein [Ralstonia pseudosolanacearum]|uniref:hypothetical protein n=1 Tax=Ralstonia pseudosolanacearum TaxID=1310165 RepID=UPI001FF9BD52|nr:hypothetical protein [Ralstonia pseudosolanacearum]
MPRHRAAAVCLTRPRRARRLGIKTGSFAGRTTYPYDFDDITTTNVIISNQDEVETVFFIK